MGDWRTVQLIGEVKNPDEVMTIRKYLKVDKGTYESQAYKEDDIFFLQSGDGLCGLNDWVKTNGKINIVGNLYERDCSIEELEDELYKIANRFKSLNMVVHAGGEYESLDCVASFKVANGTVVKVDPMVKEIDKIDSARMQVNLLRALGVFR